MIVTQNTQESTARILSSAGHPLLDVGEASTESVAERLAATGAFTPRRIDGNGVRLLVDNKPFVPRSSDPQLSSLQMGWLPEVVLLGHEILAERLERGVQRTTVERRIRALRVRRCRSLSLVVDECEVAPQDAMDWYGFEHAELPTLILSEDVPLSWLTLSRDLAETVQRLLDTRFRFLEPLLWRLAQSQDGDSLHPPSDEALAAALRCDTDSLQEYRAALRTDAGHVLHLLTPIVAYFGNVDLARRLERDAELGQEQFDVRKWLSSWLPVTHPTPADLIGACEGASSRTALREKLDLDYEQFNRVLQALGEAPLSNEDDLRSMYDAYLKSMRPKILERLRRHHAANFRAGRDLSVYVSRKSLEFLEFDASWILTRESSTAKPLKRMSRDCWTRFSVKTRKSTCRPFAGFSIGIARRPASSPLAGSLSSVLGVAVTESLSPTRGAARTPKPWPVTSKTWDCSTSTSSTTDRFPRCAVVPVAGQRECRKLSRPVPWDSTRTPSKKKPSVAKRNVSGRLWRRGASTSPEPDSTRLVHRLLQHSKSWRKAT